MGHKPSAAAKGSVSVICGMPKMIGEETSGLGNKEIQGICTKESDIMLSLSRADKT